MISTTMQGTCLARIVNGRCIGTAKRFPVGWVVRSHVSRPWVGDTKVNRRPHMTNVKVASTKNAAIVLLTGIEVPL